MAVEIERYIVQRSPALELQRGEARGDLVQAGAVLVERRQRLVGLGQHHRDVLEDVLGAVHIQRDDLAALGDGDHQRVGLLGDALGGAVAGARLVRKDRGVGHQLDVGRGDLGGIGVEDDRAVHLGHLVEEGGGVVDVELDPTRVQEGQLLGVADHDQPPSAGVQDALDPLAQGSTRRDHLQCLHQTGLWPSFSVEIFPGSWWHRYLF
jgi:hypothetical protein